MAKTKWRNVDKRAIIAVSSVQDADFLLTFSSLQDTDFLSFSETVNSRKIIVIGLVQFCMESLLVIIHEVLFQSYYHY